jgi:Rrf2 family transcriptional regulator, iron-sulfur cluster assembly transcription factor
MLSLSHTTGYAILALGFLDKCGGRLVLAKDITKATGIPLPYLSKILHTLSGTGLVVGKRGYQGGFALSRPADKISLFEVTQAVEGPHWMPSCPLGIVGCSKKPLCPIHDFWVGQRAEIYTELRRVTLADMSAYVREKFLSNVVGYNALEASGPPLGKRIISTPTALRSQNKSSRKLSNKSQK